MGFQLGLVVGLLSLGGGIVSGLLGISGAVIMVPLLLYIPPLLDVGDLSVKTVAAVAITQGLFAASSATLAHGRNGFINRRIALIGGACVASGALAGGVLSRWAPDVLLLVLFAGAATLAVAFMVCSKEAARESETNYQLRRPWRLGIFFPEGLMAGMVGVGGGFITMPILYRIFGVPLRTAIASSLAMSWFGILAGFLGKAATGQVPYWLAAIGVLGAIPGAQIGAFVNYHIPRPYLRYLFAGLLVFIALSIWLEALNRMGVV